MPCGPKPTGGVRSSGFEPSGTYGGPNVYQPRSRLMDMQLPPTMASHSQGIVEPIYLHLPVTDPETIAALSESSEGRDRQELALTALKIGILSLKAACGTVDGAAIRHERDRLLALEERLVKHRELMDESLGGTLRSYFDPRAALSPSA